MSMYLPKENEIQRIYSELGLVVPVGDLSTTKAPAIKPLSSSSTQTSITTQFNVMSGADITSLAYKVNDGESVSVTPQKGIVTITLSDLEYNSGPYEIELTATNETGSTSTSNTVDLQHYTNWATPDEVLLGNKYIGEDGEEHTGEYEAPTPELEYLPVTPSTSNQSFTPSTGYDGFNQVDVSAVDYTIDANIADYNIKDGVTILGVTGSYQGGTPQLLTNLVTNPSLGWTIGEHDLDGFTEIGDYSFSNKRITGTVTIPEGITTIGQNAFNNVNTAFSLPSTLRTIDGEAFYSAGDHVSSLVIPQGVTSIGSACFAGSQFQSVTIPSSVTFIDDSAFGFSQVKTIVCNASITSLPSAFANGSTALTSVTLPSTLQSFTDSGFDECSSLPSITIPASVTDMFSNMVFTRCSALREIHFLGNMPNTYNSDDDEQFYPFGNYDEWQNDDNDEQRICGAQWDGLSQQWTISGTIYVPTGDSTWDNVASEPAFATLLDNGWTLARE